MLLQATIYGQLFKRVVEPPDEPIKMLLKFSREMTMVTAFGPEKVRPLLDDEIGYMEFADSVGGRDEIKKVTVIKFPIELL